MQLLPSNSTRFTSFLEQNYHAFCDALYQCQTHTQRYHANDIILKQGQDITVLYIVSVGKVSMNICAVNGRRFQLGEVQCDHHIFGEMEFFTGDQCQWNVVANDEMVVDVICAKKFQQCLIDNPHFSLFFTSALACDYQDSMDLYTNRLLYPIAYNIAYDLWQRQQTHVTLGAFDKADKEAERFGTSSRVYRRAVKSLVEKGLIEKTNQGITIIDWKELEHFIFQLPED